METQYFWGLPNLNDFGWDNPTNAVESLWMRYHIQGSLEVIDQMLDEYDNRQDTDFARNKLVPFADAIVTSYDQQWTHTADGRLRLSPSQSLETYQLNAVNPTPDIAGLKTELGRLVALPDGITTDEERVRWKRMLDELPPLPTGHTFAGKIPRQVPMISMVRRSFCQLKSTGKPATEKTPSCTSHSRIDCSELVSRI